MERHGIHYMERFNKLTDRINALNMANGLLYWDMATGAPKGGNESRAKFMGIVSAEAFALMVSDEMKSCLDELMEKENELDEITKGLYKKCKRVYDSFKKIPVDDIQAYGELTANAQNIWEQAKENSDFSMFATTLNEIIQFNIKFINYRGYEGHPYNTLLDDYEPGMTVDKLDTFFAKMKNTIVPLLRKVTESKKKIDTGFTTRFVSIDKQEKISEFLMKKLGYDLEHGMLKVSAHPFTIGFGRNDVRITTHYKENDFLSSFFSVMHETGHALYEQNKMAEIENTMLDDGISMGIHESQSRFYENVIGRSLEFWQSIYNEIMDILGDEFKDVTITQFYEAANEAKASLIRTEADELTYSLHIMIRYEIEKMLMEGKYNISDLPRLWNEKIKEYLGLIPENDSMGVLQDVHWSGGSFGYFPSYSLGNAYAAQLLAYMSKEMNVFELITADKINVITDWLKKHIHQYGALRSPAELIKQIAGEELNADYYVDYLTKKYTIIYELD